MILKIKKILQKNNIYQSWDEFVESVKFNIWSFITRNMGQDGDGHAHFDQIWRPNITINYMGVDQNVKI
jgi:hypothetical protein